MYKKIYNLILEYNKIILIRHKNPDYDAYGSQLGLYFSLKESFPEKDIYIDGDDNANNIFNIPMDKMTAEDYKDALVILTDQSCINMLNDTNYQYASKVIVMDHHENKPEVGDIVLIKSDYSSASEMVAEFIKKTELKMPKKSANALFSGVVGDSGRFYYKGTQANTFNMAAYLVDSGADIFNCYKLMSKDETINEKKIKGFVLSNFLVEGKVAYIQIPKKVRDELGINPNYASRACVNLLSGIKDIEAFVNFTESDEDSIYVEIRSLDIPVVDVAKKFGGGGHNLACGTTIKSFENVHEVIEALNEIVGGKQEWIFIKRFLKK